MDEVLLKQLVRQLRILNLWVRFFGILFIATLAIGGFLLFKLVTYVHHADQSIQNLQTKTSQTLDVQNKACGSSSLKSIATSAGLCK